MGSQGKNGKAVWALLILTVLCLTCAFGLAQERKTVRVGYMIYDGYQEGGPGGIKSGCAYEYYQRIRYYTGWDYVYEYGSIGEMFERLEKGEIDIMALVTRTPERREKYFFSDEPHGLEAFYLYAHAENESVSAEDIATLDAKTIGVTQGTYQEMYLAAWCEEKGLDCTIVPYAYVEDMHEALLERRIDAMMDVRVLEGDKGHTMRCIHRFEANPLYFAVSKQRPDILAELNAAQAQIVAADEFYAYELMEKYHDGATFHNAHLSAGQQAWVNERGVLRVGYLEGTNPISFTDEETGKMLGLGAVYLEAMTEAYGMRFETVAYPSEKELIEALRRARVDVVFPLCIGYWAAEDLGISLSMPIDTIPMSAIYRRTGMSAAFERIAVIRGSVMQRGFVEQNYPDADIVEVKGTEEALDAIDRGEVDTYFVRSSSMDLLNERFHIDERFYTMGLTHRMEAFMASRISDIWLSAVLDKGITLITDTQRDAAKIRYGYEKTRVSLVEALRDNWLAVTAMAVALVLLLALVALTQRRRMEVAHMRALREEKERAEAAYQHAEQAQRAKTDFLTQMSHDIRTPMNAVIGFTRFAKEAQSLETVKREYLPRIETASDQLLMLINDVLEMSRIESGKLVFVRGDHDIEQMAARVISVVRLEAERKRLNLTTRVDVRDRYVHCDANHLSRVMLNLLSNAVKFTPEGGSVSLTIEQDRPEDTPGQGRYIIRVSDTGIGMSPAFAQRVFEPFERERTSTVSGMQGTGLGMAIVKRIVDTAGDEITVDSTLGKGTTFTLRARFRLTDPAKLLSAQEPMEDAAAQELTPQALSARFAGKRILLAEDNEFNTMIAVAVLEGAGFFVETAGDGQEAVAKVEQAPATDYYDAILMDIQMPVMDGYEAARRIRAMEDARAKVKIIAVTANAFESDRSEAERAGMDGHVAKPLDVEELYRTLMQMT